MIESEVGEKTFSGEVGGLLLIIAEMVLAMGMKLRHPKITDCPFFGDLPADDWSGFLQRAAEMENVLVFDATVTR